MGGDRVRPWVQQPRRVVRARRGATVVHAGVDSTVTAWTYVERRFVRNRFNARNIAADVP